MTDYITLPKQGKDVTGQRFGRLVALGPVDFRPETGVMWECRCDCGNITVVRVRNLGYGTTKSCGCLFRDSATTRAMTHGKCYTRLYSVWQNMIHRCHSPNDDAYHHYGGRGISVYPEWRASFEDFEFYVAQLPNYEIAGYTLDRIDNDGDYKPGNVKWSTQAEQLRHTRRTRLFTLNGKTQCFKDWCQEFGIGVSTFYERLGNGWDIERALRTPVRVKHYRGTEQL